MSRAKSNKAKYEAMARIAIAESKGRTTRFRSAQITERTADEERTKASWMGPAAIVGALALALVGIAAASKKKKGH